MLNNLSSHKDILKALYTQNTESFVIFSNVLVPPFSTRWHELSKDGWTVIPTSGGTEYYQEFSITSTPKDWLESIDSLNRLLVAYFISDFSPRRIHSFEIPEHLELEKRISLFTVFGPDKSKLFHSDEKNMLTFEMSGVLFNGFTSSDPNTQTDISLINEWSDILKDKVLFNCVTLIKESFILINRQFSAVGYSNYVDLAMGIMLLVSALEGLFTNGQDNSGDIKFKFGLIGSLYYQKNVTVEFLKRFIGGETNSKFTESQFKVILSSLYDLRSDVAHGSYRKVYEGRNWKKLLAILNVYYDDNFDKAILSRQAALALGLLQKHIFALIIQSKADLTKGVKIIDEIKI